MRDAAVTGSTVSDRTSLRGEQQREPHNREHAEARGLHAAVLHVAHVALVFLWRSVTLTSSVSGAQCFCCVLTAFLPF